MTAHVLTWDVETRSKADLGDVGMHKYAGDPSTEMLCVGYAIDDEKVQIWHPGQKVPKAFVSAANGGGWTSVAHNHAFETQIMRCILGPRHGFPIIPMERQVCTMAQVLALALPGALGKATNVFPDPDQQKKDTVGNLVMLQMTKPRKPRKGEDPGKTYWYEDQERYSRLDAYCMQDVAATRELYYELPQLSPEEQQVWLLDQQINNRGFYIDEKLALAAQRIIESMKPRINTELTQITNGEVEAFTQVARLKEWLKPHCGDVLLNKGAIEDLLKGELPAHVRRVIELRELGAQAAAAKVEALLSRRQNDGRVRGAFVYHAAGTARWSSRGAQVHNLKRPETAPEDMQKALDVIGKGKLDLALKTYENPLAIIGDLIRPMIIAAPGNMLIGGDFSGIEARVTAWLADEHSKLDVFRAFDAGTGPDPYIITAANIFRVNPTKLAVDYKSGKPDAREMRQVGKACLHADTLVLTYAGWKKIINVSIDDLLWDGESWVRHQGLLDQGTRPTIKIHGVSITPDHLIRVGSQWMSAQTVGFNANILSRALATALVNLPSLDSIKAQREGHQPWLTCNALAEPPCIKSTTTICEKENQRDAMLALRNKLVTGAKSFGTMLTSSLMMLIDDVCLTAFPLVSIAATTPTMVDITVTVDGEFQYLNRGTKTAELFWRTLSRWMVGIIQNYNWIASTTTKAMHLGIFNSLHQKKTKQIDVPYKDCSNVSSNLKPVYDLANAGPQNQFTILTDQGPLIVHNCELAFGYQGGVNAYRRFAPGGRGDDHGNEFMDRARNEHHNKIQNFTDAEVNHIKHTWRRLHPNIERFWHSINRAAWHAVAHHDAIVTCGKITLECDDTPFMYMTLPSGRRLAYPHARIARTFMPPDSGLVIEVRKGSRLPLEYQFYENDQSKFQTSVIFKDNAKSWRDVRMYGGFITENLVQAIARDLLAEAMLRIEKAGYKIVLHVHDSCYIEVPERNAEKALKQFTKLLCELPPWASGLPLTAKTHIGKRFS